MCKIKIYTLFKLVLEAPSYKKWSELNLPDSLTTLCLYGLIWDPAYVYKVGASTEVGASTKVGPARRWGPAQRWGGCNLFTTITPCLHHSVPPKRSIIGGINIINMNTGKIDSARDSSPANRGLIWLKTF
jgi:hypothetical protein